MIDNLIKKMYIKRFGKIYTKEQVDKLEKTVSDLRHNIVELKTAHDKKIVKLTNEFKDEKLRLECIIDAYKKKEESCEAIVEEAPKSVDAVAPKRSKGRKRTKKAE